jgi:ribosome-binding protein aMBF1 (putative translation factor)
MKAPAHACDLCGLAVPAKPFRASADGTERLFCCEGCRTIWMMLNADIEQATEDDQQDQRQRNAR